MSGAGARWRAFWFTPVPVRRLAVLRILVAAYVLVDVLLGRWRLRYGDVADAFYEPIDVLRLLAVPRLGREALTAVAAVLVVCAACALVGVATRAALALAAPLYVLWYATYYSYGEVSNTKTAIALALVVLAVGPSGRTYSIDGVRARRRARPASAAGADEVAGWAFRVLTVLLVYMYLFAGLSKLAVTGPGWWRSGAFELGLAAVTGPGWWRSGAFELGIADGGTALALWLAQHHLWAVHALALGALAFELCAPALLVRGRVQRVYAAVAVAFHLATLGLLRLDFLGMALVCAAVVSDVERLPRAIGALGRAVVTGRLRAIRA